MVIRNVLIVCVVSFGLFGNAVADLNSGLVAHYKFDGNANDSSGKDHHGTVSGAELTHDRLGNPNKAYSFNGGETKITVPDSNDWYFLDNNFSISLWVKSSTSSEQYFVGQGIDSNNGWAIYLPNDGNNLRFISRGGSGQIIYDVSFPNSLVNEWNLITLVRNSNIFTFYINNEVQESMNSSFSIPNLDVALAFGKSVGSGYSYQGDLDEARIYDRALSESEIKEIYVGEPNCTVSDPTMVALNLDIHIPSATYQSLSGTSDIWVNLEYLGTNSDGKHIWGLKDYGAN